MAQPPDVTAAAGRLTALYQTTQRSLETRIADAATHPAARRRLQALYAQVTAEIDALRGGLAAWLTTDLPAVYTVGAQTAATAAGTRFNWTGGHRDAVQALAERTWAPAAETLRDIETNTRQAIRRLLDDNTRAQILEGMPRGGRQLTEALRAETGLASVTYRNGATHSMADYGDTLARTDAAIAHNTGTFTQARTDGIGFMECADGPDCGLAFHDDPEKVNGRTYPLEVAENYPLAHPRCVMPDTPITVHGELVEMVRARYSGPRFDLTFTTSTGAHTLTVGPHHPVLTRTGWRPGHLIREGDELVYDLRHDDPLGPVDLDLDQVPRAEDLFESLRCTGDSETAPAASDDLHGDAVFCEGEVEVVRPARRLLVEGDPSAHQKVCQPFLVGSDADLSFVPDEGGSSAFFAAVAAPPGGVVGGAGVSLGLDRTLLGGHALPPMGLGLGHRAADPRPPEGRPDGSPVDPELCPRLLGGQTLVHVEAPQLVQVDGMMAFGSAVDPALRGPAGMTLDRGTATVAVAPGVIGLGEVGHRFAFAKVVTVDVSWYDGSVYDLTTTAGTFGGTGCVIKNCARGWFVAPGVTDAEGAEEARRFTDEEQATMAAEEAVRARTRLVTGEPVGTLGRRPRAPRAPRAPRTAR